VEAGDLPMKRIVAVLGLLGAAAALALAACGGSSSSPTSAGGASSNPSGEIPAELEAAVERAAASGVPVRIPPALLEALPAGANHAEVLRSPADSYTLGLATRRECRFKSDCLVAVFSGSSGGGELTGRKLQLAEGVEGVYEPGRCGPGCQFGTVAWRQNGDLYGAGIPEASVPELVALANEAIESDPPR
jgi:hypothetical protein